MTTTHYPQGPSGADGLDGEPWQGAAGAGAAGREGVLSLIAYPSALAPSLPQADRLEPLLDAAELMFINGDVKSARSELLWFVELLPALDAGGTSTSPGARVLAARATMLLSYMEHGLDAFGRGPDYLSLRTFDEQKADLLERLRLADDLLEHAEMIAAKGSAQRDRETALAAGLDRLRSETERLRRKAADIIAALKAYDVLLVQMRTDLDAAWAELGRAAAEFKGAVERGHCGFDEILEFGAMVATAYATGGAALAVVAATKSALKESEKYSKNKESLLTSLSIKDVQADGKQIAGIVQPVVASVEAFREAYKKAKEALTKTPAPERPEFGSDYVKLVVDKDKFDKQIEPFLALPEAKNYQSLMQRFVDIAEARNNKVLERDAALSQLIGIRQNVQEVEHQFEVISAATSAGWDERVQEVASVYERISRRLAPDMARSILNMSASLRMVFPDRPIRLVDLSLPAIKAALLEAIASFERILEAQGQPEFEVRGVNVKMAQVLTRPQIDDFVAGKPVVFSLPRAPGADVFAGFYLVQTLSMAFEDEHGKVPVCQIAVQNLGSSAIRGSDGTFRMFNHAPVTARFGHGNQGEAAGQLQERGDGFIGVSPYGPWRIRAAAGAREVLRSVASGKVRFDVEARQLPA